MPPIVGRARTAQCGTRCPRADHRSQIDDGLIDHHFGPSPFVSAPPVANRSSNAESFPCTSITRRAVARSDCKRALSFRSRASSLAPRVTRRPTPRSAQCLQCAIIALLAPFRDRRCVQPLAAQEGTFAVTSRRSYSARIFSLYCAENTRRVARSVTSGSAGSLICRVRGQPGGQQADGQEAADALDSQRGPFAAAGPHSSPERRSRC